MLMCLSPSHRAAQRAPPHDRPGGGGGESEANDLWRSLPESLQRL